MSEIKLLPCPFCGGEAEFYRTPIKSNGGWCDSVVVRCKECEARTNRVLYNSEKYKNDSEYEEAIKQWNTRKPMQEIMERLEERHRNHEEHLKHYREVKDWDSAVKQSRMKTENEIAIEIVKKVGGMIRE